MATVATVDRKQGTSGLRLPLKRFGVKLFFSSPTVGFHCCSAKRRQTGFETTHLNVPETGTRVSPTSAVPSCGHPWKKGAKRSSFLCCFHLLLPRLNTPSLEDMKPAPFTRWQQFARAGWAGCHPAREGFVWLYFFPSWLMELWLVCLLV